MSKIVRTPEYHSEDLIYKIHKVNNHRYRFCSINIPVLGAFKDKYALFYKMIKAELLRQLPGKYLDYTQDEVIRFCGETVRQKLHSMLSLSRFVIAHDTDASGEIIELGYCKNVGAITAILRRKGEISTSMTSDFQIHSNDFVVFEYDCEDNRERLVEKAEKEKTQKEMAKKIGEIISWAENRRATREGLFSIGFREDEVWELPPLPKRSL